MTGSRMAESLPALIARKIEVRFFPTAAAASVNVCDTMQSPVRDRAFAANAVAYVLFLGEQQNHGRTVRHSAIARSRNILERDLAAGPASRNRELFYYGTASSSTGGTKHPGSFGFGPQAGSQNRLFCQHCSRSGHRES